MGKTPGRSSCRRQEGGGSAQATAFIGVSSGEARQGGCTAWDRLVGIISIGFRLLGWSLVLKAEEYFPLGCKGQGEEMSLWVC